MSDWKSQDNVALRSALSKIKSHRLKEEIMSKCPAIISAEDALKATSEGIARLGAYRAGYEKCIDSLIAIALDDEVPSQSPDYRDMS